MKLKPLENTVVNTITQKEYDELMRIYEDAGWIWDDGQIPTERDIWYISGKNSYIEVRNEFDFWNKEYSKEIGFKIISFAEFKKIQGIGVKPKNKEKKEVKMIAVSRVPLYFNGLRSIEKDKDKTIVVVNMTNKRPIAAFEFVKLPLPIKVKCKSCYGTGKIDYKVKSL